MKVLLVEDNQIVIMGIQKTLLAEFPTTVFYTAENGKEGLDLLTNLDQKDLPDFILLDINMPIMNGIEFLKRIKKVSTLSTIPVIIHTTSSNVEDFNACNSLGISGYFLKLIDYKQNKKNLLLIANYWMASFSDNK